MRWAHLLVLLGACYRSPGDGQCRVTSCSGGGLDDGGPGQEGGGGEGGPGEVCAGEATGFLQSTCFNPVPAARTLPAMVDTDAIACDRVLSDPVACIVVVDTVDSSATVEVTGGRALVLWSASTLTVAGAIDAAGHNAPATTGPGRSEVCASVSGSQGGGGAGGAFGGAAGAGGDATGAGGSPGGSVAMLDHIRAGCPGAPGGAPNAGGGGRQGGAIYAMAHDAVIVSGTINASGGGGFAPGMAGGGGGGGSGGLIGLDAPNVTIASTGHVFAVGGGGASGGGFASGGAPGKEASCCPLMGAVESPPSENTNFGGAGATGTSTGENGGTGVGAGGAGGGGGGGSTGFVKVFASAAFTPDGDINPPPSF